MYIGIYTYIFYINDRASIKLCRYHLYQIIKVKRKSKIVKQGSVTRLKHFHKV